MKDLFKFLIYLALFIYVMYFVRGLVLLLQGHTIKDITNSALKDEDCLFWFKSPEEKTCKE